MRSKDLKLNDSMNDSAVKFERQVNINTILNSAIGTGHRHSRRSMAAYNGHIPGSNARNNDLNESFESTSSIEESNNSNNSEDSEDHSISSHLSNTKTDQIKNYQTAEMLIKKNNQKLVDLSFLSSSNSSSINSNSSSISLQLLEPPATITQNIPINTNNNTKEYEDKQKTDYLKVQDYLNELNILSQQNTFRAESSEQTLPQTKQILDTTPSSGTRCEIRHNKTTLAPPLTTPQRPQSLLTPIKKSNIGNNLISDPSQRLSQILANNNQPNSPVNAGQQMLLHLQILKNQQVCGSSGSTSDDLVNLYTNTSETSSGYLSNSTQNLNLDLSRLIKSKQDRDSGSVYSSSVTPPMPAAGMLDNGNNEKRFSYNVAATASNNTLNIDTVT